MKLCHSDIHSWMYKYDRSARVWRAFHTSGIEVNQYHKYELFFVMGKLGDPIEWDSLPTTTQVDVLTKEEKQLFLTKT